MIIGVECVRKIFPLKRDVVILIGYSEKYRSYGKGLLTSISLYDKVKVNIDMNPTNWRVS